MFVCRNDLECPENKDFDEHYHSFEKCSVCGKMTTCAECLCGFSRIRTSGLVGLDGVLGSNGRRRLNVKFW